MKKHYEVISKCPVCAGELRVSKLTCETCHTSIEGVFRLSKFNYLDAEKLYFIEVFVKNKGNIKAVEKELGISYPTVKKLLDETIMSLGYEVSDQDETPAKETRSHILDALSRKEIDVETALQQIKESKGN